MRHLLCTGALAASLVAGMAVPAAAQSDIILRLQSGSPSADRVRVDSGGGFVAMGSLGIGLIPQSGAGERMMWHPYRSAFRAGSVSSTGSNLWDDGNIGFYSTAFGLNAAAQDIYAFAVGGWVNADGDAAIAMGHRSTADANYAIAIGRAASVDGHAGAIVLTDGSTADSLLATADNQFNLRAAGGIRLFTNSTATSGVLIQAAASNAPWSGCSSVNYIISASNCAYLSGAGAWTNVSDVNRKHGFAAVAGEDVLTRLRGMPITTWTYNAEGNEVRHLGPTAQDFHAAFGLSGSDDTHITTVDADGVALAAAQALDARTREQAETIADQQRTIDAQGREIAELRARLERIEALLGQGSAPTAKP
jgi:hypothetical protein